MMEKVFPPENRRYMPINAPIGWLALISHPTYLRQSTSWWCALINKRAMKVHLGRYVCEGFSDKQIDNI